MRLYAFFKPTKRIIIIFITALFVGFLLIPLIQLSIFSRIFPDPDGNPEPIPRLGFPFIFYIDHQYDVVNCSVFLEGYCVNPNNTNERFFLIKDFKIFEFSANLVIFYFVATLVGSMKRSSNVKEEEFETLKQKWK